MNKCTACEAYQTERVAKICAWHSAEQLCLDCGEELEWNVEIKAWECHFCMRTFYDDRDYFDFINSEIN